MQYWGKDDKQNALFFSTEKIVIILFKLLLKKILVDWHQKALL